MLRIPRIVNGTLLIRSGTSELLSSGRNSAIHLLPVLQATAQAREARGGLS